MIVSFVGALLIAAGAFTMLGAFGVVGVIGDFGGSREDTVIPFLVAALGLAMVALGVYLLRRPRRGDPFGGSP